MKNQMYITLLILPLLATGCGGRKETAQTMPVPEISVARPCWLCRQNLSDKWLFPNKI